MSRRIEDRIKCLLCEDEKKEKEKCSLKHIHDHLGYKKYVCKSCEFSCYTDDEAMLHKYKWNHVVLHNNNKYKEALSNLIYLNCLHAAEFGLSAVVSDGIINDSQSLLDSVSHSSFTGDRKKVKAAEIEKRIPRNSSSKKNKPEKKDIIIEPSNKGNQASLSRRIKSGDADDTSKRSTEVLCEVKSKGRSDKQLLPSVPEKSAISGHFSAPNKSGKICCKDSANQEFYPPSLESGTEVWPGLSSSYENYAFVSKRNSGLQSTKVELLKCRKCDKEIDESYPCRKEHILKEHLAPKDHFSESVVCTEMRLCFPACIIYSDEQCIACGRFVKTDQGRRTHVSSHHFAKKIECVVPGCSLFEANPNDLKRHIESVHGVPISSAVSGDTFRLYSCAKKEYEASLAVEIIRYFPFDLPGRASCNTNELATQCGIQSVNPTEHSSAVNSDKSQEASLQCKKLIERRSSGSSGSSECSLQEILRDRRNKKTELSFSKAKNDDGYASKIIKNTKGKITAMTEDKNVKVSNIVKEENDNKLESSSGSKKAEANDVNRGDCIRAPKPLLGNYPLIPQFCEPERLDDQAGSSSYSESQDHTLIQPLNSPSSLLTTPTSWNRNSHSSSPNTPVNNQGCVRNDNSRPYSAPAPMEKATSKSGVEFYSRKKNKIRERLLRIQMKLQPFANIRDSNKKKTGQNSATQSNVKQRSMSNVLNSNSLKKNHKRKRGSRGGKIREKEHRKVQQKDKQKPSYGQKVSSISTPNSYRFEGLQNKKSTAGSEQCSNGAKSWQNLRGSEKSLYGSLEVSHSAEVRIMRSAEEIKSLTDEFLSSSSTNKEIKQEVLGNVEHVSSTPEQTPIPKKRENTSPSVWLGKKKRFSSSSSEEEKIVNMKVEVCEDASGGFVETIKSEPC